MKYLAQFMTLVFVTFIGFSLGMFVEESNARDKKEQDE